MPSAQSAERAKRADLSYDLTHTSYQRSRAGRSANIIPIFAETEMLVNTFSTVPPKPPFFACSVNPTCIAAGAETYAQFPIQIRPAINLLNQVNRPISKLDNCGYNSQHYSPARFLHRSTLSIGGGTSVLLGIKWRPQCRDQPCRPSKCHAPSTCSHRTPSRTSRDSTSFHKLFWRQLPGPSALWPCLRASRP